MIILKKKISAAFHGFPTQGDFTCAQLRALLTPKNCAELRATELRLETLISLSVGLENDIFPILSMCPRFQVKLYYFQIWTKLINQLKTDLYFQIWTKLINQLKTDLYFQIWTKLIHQLKTDLSVFSGADRAQLIDDAFSLCMAGTQSMDRQ